MPTLTMALDPSEVQRRFERGLPRLAGEHGSVHLRAIRVPCYKPRRRCVIEYDVEVNRTECAQPGRGSAGRHDRRPPPGPSQAATLIGKMRAGHFSRTGYWALEALWNAGFSSESADGISVPEPIGLMVELRMWLQRKVPGQLATDLIARPEGEALVRRIAEAAHKLHAAGVPGGFYRRHTMADELRILRERLPAVAQAEPRWAGRIARLLDAADRLGDATPGTGPRWIHRDFYAHQVIVDPGWGPRTRGGARARFPREQEARLGGWQATVARAPGAGTEGAQGGPGPGRLYLIDFDMYTEGDPGLDIGNFLGHLTEQSLRNFGDPEALLDQEQAMEERFVALAGEATRPAVRAYAALTLVRHVHLSTLFPARRPLTASLLEVCEDRLLARGSQHAARGGIGTGRLLSSCAPRAASRSEERAT